MPAALVGVTPIHSTAPSLSSFLPILCYSVDSSYGASGIPKMIYMAVYYWHLAF
jgi:hypothetical protein